MGYPLSFLQEGIHSNKQKSLFYGVTQAGHHLLCFVPLRHAEPQRNYFTQGCYHQSRSAFYQWLKMMQETLKAKVSCAVNGRKQPNERLDRIVTRNDREFTRSETLYVNISIGASQLLLKILSCSCILGLELEMQMSLNWRPNFFSRQILVLFLRH